jgi:Mce-associated membrane protein
MDDDVATTIEPAAGEQTPVSPEPTRSRRLPSAAALIFAILVAVILAEAVLLFRSNSGEQARTEVLQTSTSFLSALTTYNSSTIETQRKRVLGLVAGKFRQQYEQVTSPEFVRTLTNTKADQKGSVIRAAVASVQDDSATVLALIRTTTTNKDLKAARVEQSVIELSLVHTKNGWKIDNVTIVGTLAA